MSQLPELLQQLEEHEIYNPDDELVLTGDEFLSVTDTTTADLINKIVVAAEQELVDHGTASGYDNEAIAALRRQGINIQEGLITVDHHHIHYGNED